MNRKTFRACGRPIAAGALLACMFVTLRPTEASAQDDPRFDLNRQAIEAIGEDDYDAAISLLEESIEIGALNITYLNLGRSYAKAGRCRDALAAYDKMAVAPRVEEPPPEVLYEVLQKYRSELLTDCPGTVAIRCAQDDLMVGIDDAEPQPCPESPVDLPPGVHEFTASVDGQVVDRRVVEVEGLSLSYVSLSAPVAVPDMAPRPESGLGTMGWTGIAVSSVGAAALITAIALDVVLLSDADTVSSELEKDIPDYGLARDIEARADDKRFASLILYGAGGSLVTTGLTLLLIDALTDEEAGGSRAGIDVHVAPTADLSGPRIGISGRF